MYDTALLATSPYMQRELWDTGPIKRKEKLSKFAVLHNELRSGKKSKGISIETVLNEIVENSDTEFVESRADVLEIIQDTDIEEIIAEKEEEQKENDEEEEHKEKSQSIELTGPKQKSGKASASYTFNYIALRSDTDVVSEAADVLTVIYETDIGETISMVLSGDEPSREIPLARLMSDAKKRDVGYYETEFDTPEDLWRESLQTPQTHLATGDTRLSPSNNSQPAKFGFEFGSIVDVLMTEESAKNEVIWGFIIALIGRSHREIAEEKSEMAELITSIEQMHKSREKNAKNMTYLEDKSNSGSPYSEIKGEVEAAGYRPNPVILQEVEYHTTVDHGLTEAYKNNVRRIIRDIEEKLPLIEINEFAETVAHDIEQIDAQKKELDSISEVIKEVWSMEEGKISETSKNLGDKLDVRTDAITAGLHLVDDGTHREMITEAPLVEEHPSETSPAWSLTEYGKVVSKTKFEHKGLDWIYRYIIGPEELSLDERILLSHCLDEHIMKGGDGDDNEVDKEGETDKEQSQDN
ncbi:hypothetical protein [Halorubrum vacuolatum]|uniref:Uncharacterized protein n=1 Tax=Halorubrum vacuolatum TaxID=63740 RepID=A0A238Y0F0_HALVU|nr:hypothetical protein [Halorubrum vacuolatum]SNR64705.1 hypothetical protein SAMN06264855_12713 [Halorubrum vacuolatum]